MKAKAPVSRAKTAYGLLSDVCQLITEEPLRYNQYNWILRKVDGVLAADKFPTCGTIGCVAGWVATLKSKRKFVHDETEDVATKVLGLVNSDQAFELFNSDAVLGAPQTPTHARNGVRHIRKFQKKYRAQLLAKKV